MRLLAAAVLTLIAADAAHAQGAADTGPPLGPPRIFAAAGYSQPDITPGLCKSVSAQITQCTVPEMTVGQYLIQATGTSTAQATDAVQQLTIQVGDISCYATRRGTSADPWNVGVARTFKYNCVVTVMTDQPLAVSVVYADLHATRDPKGPTLSFRRLPWNGVVNLQGSMPQQ